MIEIHMTETDLLVEIVTKLRFNGASFHVRMTRDMWKVEIL
jgi:hypothetical protein